MKVSILVTYYNQEKFVERSLKSIFSQNLNCDYEVLVGDDGSQDSTCKIVNEFSEKHKDKIRLFIQDRDVEKKYNSIERASYNRLNLLKNAKGEYVCFLDGDDEYCDFNWIQEACDILDKNKNLSGVAHKYCNCFYNGKMLTPAGIKKTKRITAKMYAKKFYTHVGTILFRNKFSDADYNMLKSLKSFDDNDITFYFLNFGDIYCRDKIVYNYYQNENSIWNSADTFERNLINAIDYEILLKISTFHNELFLKYFSNLYHVYKNKERLQEALFTKYLVQTQGDGVLIKLFKWNELTQNEKNKINRRMKTKRLYYYFIKFLNVFDFLS